MLGKRPAVGTSYGCRIEPFLTTTEIEHWGELHYFTKLEPEQKVALKTGFKTVWAKLKHHGLTGIAPFALEIRPAKGKNLGMYYPSKGEDDLHKIMIRPQLDNAQTAHGIAHEAGHAVWQRLMGRKARASWVKKYHSFVKLEVADPEKVKELRNDFCKQADERVKDFRGQLEEGDADLFTLCCSWIADNHGLSAEYIDTLILAGDGDTVKSMWPNSKVLKTDYETPITEYAQKNPQEFFCEAFAFKILGMTLPKTIDVLMTNTLQRIAGK